MIGRRFSNRLVSTIGRITAPDRTQTEGVPLIAEGLIGCWDAWNPYSYTGSGTHFKDLSGVNRNATLINGTVFSVEGGGCFSFDGTNDCVNTHNSFSAANNLFADSNGSWSVSTWFKFPVAPLTNKTGNNGWAIVGRSRDFGTGGTFLIYVAASDSVVPFAPRILIRGVQTNIAPISLNDNRWHNISLVWTGSTLKMYLDGVYTGNATVGTAVLQNVIASFGTTVGNSTTGIFEGQIANVLIYNRGISDLEVYQNYEYARGRFGV